MENEEVLEDTSKPQEEDTSSESDVETQEGETDEEKIAKLAEANKKLFARAKKAEEEAKALKTSKEADKSSQEDKPKEEKKEEDLDKILDQKLNERDLASMDISDELKSEVKAYGKAKNILYREVLKSPYFNFLKGQEEEKTKAEEASASSKGKTIRAKRDFGNLSDEDIKNLPDDEYEEYNKWLKSQK